MTLERIGSHWLHPDRNLYGCPSFSVELLYARDASPGFDWDAVAQRVEMCRSKHVPVALRVDWRPRKVLPPMNDEDGVYDYVQAIQEAVAQYRPTWLIAGNETNMRAETGGDEMQAWWVGRVVFGHTMPTDRTDNVFQFARTIDPNVMVLAPAVGPYSPDTAGDEHGCEIPDGRGSLAPWESYMYDMARSCYDNGWHVPEIGDVKFAMHTYGRTGNDGSANGGPEEPWNDVREDTYGAQFGSRWLQDALFYCRQGLLNSPYGVDYYPGGILISEANTLTDGWPCDTYPNGWWQNLVRYVNQFPNVMGLAAFVDQDLGGMWTDTAMSVPKEQLRQWDRDHDDCLKQGWRIGRNSSRRGKGSTQSP